MNADTTVLLTIAAGATGAAVIKLVDNVVQWFLRRKDTKDAGKTQQKSEALVALEKHEDWANDRLGAICDCVAILAIEQLSWTCKHALHNKQTTLGDRQRIHAMYIKAHAIGVNGDLKDLLNLVDELPLVDPLHDDDDTVTEHRENI